MVSPMVSPRARSLLRLDAGFLDHTRPLRRLGAHELTEFRAAHAQRLELEGLPAGVRMPHQLVASAPGSPASANVGASGNATRRRAPPTPRAFSLPERTCGRFWITLPTFICTWPAIVSVSAGPPPLYCTMTMLMPACSRKSSVARCWKLPGPAALALSSPGLRLARPTRSSSEVNGTAAGTTSRLGPVATVATGVNHCSDSSCMRPSAMLTGWPTVEVYRNPASVRVGRVFSDPPINIVSGRLTPT